MSNSHFNHITWMRKVALDWFMHSRCQGKTSIHVRLNLFWGQVQAIGTGVLVDCEIFHVLGRDKNPCLKWLPITPRSYNNNTTDSDINLKYPGSPKTLQSTSENHGNCHLNSLYNVVLIMTSQPRLALKSSQWNYHLPTPLLLFMNVLSSVQMGFFTHTPPPD